MSHKEGWGVIFFTVTEAAGIHHSSSSFFSLSRANFTETGEGFNLKSHLALWNGKMEGRRNLWWHVESFLNPSSLIVRLQWACRANDKTQGEGLKCTTNLGGNRLLWVIVCDGG